MCATCVWISHLTTDSCLLKWSHLRVGQTPARVTCSGLSCLHGRLASVRMNKAMAYVGYLCVLMVICKKKTAKKALMYEMNNLKCQGFTMVLWFWSHLCTVLDSLGSFTCWKTKLLSAQSVWWDHRTSRVSHGPSGKLHHWCHLSFCEWLPPSHNSCSMNSLSKMSHWTLELLQSN